MNSTLPVVYSFRRCPYAIRARLALHVSGIEYELREVSLKSKPLEMLAASPKGTVPVMVLPGGKVIDESLNIMRWALAQNDPEGWLNQGSLGTVLSLIAVNDGQFKHALDRYKYPNRYPLESGGDGQAFALDQRHKAASWLQILEQQSGCGCLFGTQPSLADMAILPFVRQFAQTDLAWFAAQPWAQVQWWLAEFEASGLFKSVFRKPL